MTICIVVLLIFAFLFLKLCRTELKEFKEFFHGIIVAAIQELRFKAGRAAKANIILSAILALLFVFMTLTDVLREVREFLDGPVEPQSGVKYILFASLFLFFFTSLCFVFALERYSTKAKR
jgi:hypothetical protein